MLKKKKEEELKEKEQKEVQSLMDLLHYREQKLSNCKNNDEKNQSSNSLKSLSRSSDISNVTIISQCEKNQNDNYLSNVHDNDSNSNSNSNSNARMYVIHPFNDSNDSILNFPNVVLHSNSNSNDNESTISSTSNFITNANSTLILPALLNSTATNVLCQYCGKTFNHNNQLMNHVTSIHSGEKPYYCTTCHRKFGDQYSLDRHHQTHNKENLS